MSAPVATPVLAEEAEAPEAPVADVETTPAPVEAAAPAKAEAKKEPETPEQYRARWTERVWIGIGNKAFSDDVRKPFIERHAEIVLMKDDRKASDALKDLDVEIKAARADVIRGLVQNYLDKWLFWTPEGAEEPIEGKWAVPFKETAAYKEAVEWLKGLDKPSIKQFNAWMDGGYGLLSKISNPFPYNCKKCGKNIRPVLVKNRQDPEGPKVWWSPTDKCGKCHNESDLGSATRGKHKVEKPGSASRMKKKSAGFKPSPKTDVKPDGEGGKKAGRKQNGRGDRKSSAAKDARGDE